jgi:hypothetical protein
VFEKFGEIGILFNSVNEMVQYIFLIIDKTDEAFKFNSNFETILRFNSNLMKS